MVSQGGGSTFQKESQITRLHSPKLDGGEIQGDISHLVICVKLEDYSFSLAKFCLLVVSKLDSIGFQFHLWA